MIEELADMWNFLETSDTTAGQLKVREITDVELAEGHILLGLDASRHRHLLLPVAQKTKITADRRSSGVQIVAHPLVDGNKLRSFVDLVCLKPHLDELFSIIVSEVLDACQQNASQPDQICHRVLERWRELLDHESTGILSTEKLVGLFGELWFLREMVKRNAEAVRFWMGPKGARHDFSIGKQAVEVKTSLSRRGRFVEIHGHDQLEPPEDGELYLVLLKFEQVVGLGESLPEVIDSIVRLGGNRYTLLNLLAHVDIGLLTREEYRDIRFRLYENRVYEVNDEFPHITSSSFVAGTLPAGVLKLSYQIDLSIEPPVSLDDTSITQLLTDLSSAIDKL